MDEKSFLTRPPTEDDLAFRRKIAENPLYQLARDVYSDWLQEQGEQEEADRQRQWTNSEMWLRAFSSHIEPGFDEMMEAFENYQESFRQYKNSDEYGDGDHTYDNSESYKNVDFDDEFWKHYQIVSGRVVPSKRRHCPFTCFC